MKPSIGRIVIYVVGDYETAFEGFPFDGPNGTREHPAIITRAWSDDCVNLHVFFDANPSGVRMSVMRLPELPEGVERDPGATGWKWPVREPQGIGMLRADGVSQDVEAMRKLEAVDTRSIKGCEVKWAQPEDAVRTLAPLMSFNDELLEVAIAAKGLTAPRITPEDVNNQIVPQLTEYALFGGVLTVCVITLRNGFLVTGESACASPENFDAEIGRKIAFDNARQKIWALEGYRLRQLLADNPLMPAGGK